MREKKIEKAMNRMADTVIKQQEENDKILEEKIRKYEKEKEEREY